MLAPIHLIGANVVSMLRLFTISSIDNILCLLKYSYVKEGIKAPKVFYTMRLKWRLDIAIS